MPVLVDTVIASFLHKKKADSSERLRYDADLRGQVLLLSFQSVAELLLWAEKNRWGTPRRSALERFIDAFVIVPYDFRLAATWATLMTHAASIGRRLEAGDAWVAACAVRHQVPLVTDDRDLRDLNFPGLDVICHAP